MASSASVRAAVAGMRGFDCNTPVDREGAVAFYEKGYRFAVRYIRRRTARLHDLSMSEIERLHDAGLAVMPVQHVESESSWIPSADKGREYGETAALACTELALPRGVTVWNDLEGVSSAVPPAHVIAHCQAWFIAVASAGFQPGLYVGWHAGLSATQLYQNLSFTRYWGAYNLNADQEPVVRGLCMKQHVAKPVDIPWGITFPIDTDTIKADKLGGLPFVYAPAGWVP